MAKFLNTTLLNKWIPKLIDETENELVIIVPYIKTSDKMYNHIYRANQRGVETTLVYRENKLVGHEKQKFESLDNLNLMHHPNIHCKCYYNEKYLIICSMNLYEYSEINNREMGVLLSLVDLNSEIFGGDSDNKDIFEDAIKEIREIINGSNLEKKSRETIDEGFEMNIIKTEKEILEEKCKVLNKVFEHKKFEALYNSIRNDWSITCKNYFDKIHVTYERRILIELDANDKKKKIIFDKFNREYNEFRIDGVKIYWNFFGASISIYPNSKHYLWKNEMTEVQELELMKKCLNEFIQYFRKFL